MSKVEAQRAMREARFAAYRASRAAADTPTPIPPAKAAVSTPAPSPAVPATDSDAGALVAAADDLADPAGPEPLPPSADPSGEPELCGHRNIGNRSCRRPAGHAEANHRYK
jgi:hypothetical protein